MSRRIVAEFDAITGPFLSKMDRIDRSINNFERSALMGFNRIERGVDGIVSSASRLRTVMGVIATGFGANLGAQFLDQSKLIRNALREAGDESQETYEKVFRSSVRALAGFDDVAKGVQRFQKALGDRQSIDDSIRQLETLNKLLALSGKTQQERSSTFIQFSQALQAGYLGGEELRAIRENAPIELTREIAKMAGGSIEDLKELAKQGLLTTEVMVKALENLQAEADERFASIQVTIQDAANVFRSGAIVAAEGFDEGLGLSRATVTSLKTVGEILGENADAARTFGEAVKVAGAVMVTSFAGRTASRVVANLKAEKEALFQAAAAANDHKGKMVLANIAAQERVRITQAAITTLKQQGASEAKIAKATAANAAAQRKARAATEAQTAAIVRMDRAQAMLTTRTRALARAGRVLSGAWAFLGGWPGLILTAAAAFTMFGDRAETTKERVERLIDTSGKLTGSLNAVKTLEEEMTRLTKARADAVDGSTDRIIAATKREFEAKKALMKADRVDEQINQAERVREREKLRFRRAGMGDAMLEELKQLPQYKDGNPARKRQLEAQWRSGINAATAELDREIARLDAAILQSAEIISDSGKLLSMSFEEAMDGSAAAAGEARAKLVADYAGHIQKLEALVERQQNAKTAMDAAIASGNPQTVGKWAAILREIDQELKALRDEGGEVGDAVASLVSEAENLQSAMGSVIFDGNDEVRGAVNALVDQIKNAADNMDDLDGKELRSLYEAVYSVKELVDGLFQSLGLVRGELEKPYDVIARFEAAMPGSTDRGSWARSANEAAQRGILDLIGYAEGTDKGRGYNETLDYGRWTGGPVDLVNMTLKQVLELQKNMRTPENRALYGNGKGSSAVGRYQIVSTTLRSLISDLGLTGNERFTPELQDRMAQQLVRRRRGQGVEGMRNEWQGLNYVGSNAITTALGASDVPTVDEEVQKRRTKATKEHTDALEEQKDAALSYIEQAMTAEESHAAKLREMIALREKLVATYGEESELVKQMDVAIQRVKSSVEQNNEMMREFWQTMSDGIANSIEDWKGWGSLVRGILASLVREHGVDFFTALLTPGGQTGGSLGTRAGNWLSGFGFDPIKAEVLHEGGTRGRPRMDDARNWIGAPKFHDGLLPGEFRAILERGELVVPKDQVGRMSGSSSITMVNNNDFRGADPSMKAYLDQRLQQQEEQFMPRLIEAQRKMQAARIKV